MSQETVDKLFKLCIDTEAMITAIKEHSESRVESEKARSEAKINAIKAQSDDTIKTLEEHLDAATKAVKDYIVASNSHGSDSNVIDDTFSESNIVNTDTVEEVAHRQSIGMQIKIVGIPGKEANVQVDGNTTVNELKWKITRVFEIPVVQQRLLIGSRLLLDGESTLNQCSISDGAVIYVILRLCGC